ncbi:hypothetical protein EDB87DRAFT_367378 [Lactarius vividus]|nr:hypothetical protein EDB87DRAFT_367378 [Lactarius vividus]
MINSDQSPPLVVGGKLTLNNSAPLCTLCTQVADQVRASGAVECEGGAACSQQWKIYNRMRHVFCAKGQPRLLRVRVSTIRRRVEYISNHRRLAGSGSKNFFGAPTRTPRDAACLVGRRLDSSQLQQGQAAVSESPWIVLCTSNDVQLPGCQTFQDPRIHVRGSTGASYSSDDSQALNDSRPPYRLTHRYCHPAGGRSVRAFSRGSGSPLSPTQSPLLDHIHLPNKVSSTNQGHSQLRPARCLSQTTPATEQSEFSAQMNSPWIRSSGKQDNTITSTSGFEHGLEKLINFFE